MVLTTARVVAASAHRDSPSVQMATEKAKVVVMTGATGVIGEAIAEGFKTANLMAPTVSRLILICRSAARGEKVAAKLRGSLMKVDVVVADLSSPSSVSACAAELAAKHPKIDVLVNNAAVVPTRDARRRPMASKCSLR